MLFWEIYNLVVKISENLQDILQIINRINPKENTIFRVFNQILYTIIQPLQCLNIKIALFTVLYTINKESTCHHTVSSIEKHSKTCKGWRFIITIEIITENSF